MPVSHRAVLGCLILLAAAPGVARACRCRPATFASKVDRAELIVLARVVRSVDNRQVVLVVEERYKGKSADTLTLRRSDSDCELFPPAPAAGARYLLLLPLRDGPTGARKCSGSGVAEERTAELQWLRARRPTDPGPGPASGMD